MAGNLQARPDDVPTHEGNVWTPDSNTPNAQTGSGDGDELVSGINVLAKVGVQIGKATEEVAKSSERVAQLARAVERNTPTDGAKVASGVAVAGVPLVLNLFGPDAGTFWEVSSLAVGGVDINSAAIVSNWGFYSSSLASVAGAGLGNLLDVAASCPIVNRYSAGQVTANDGENLFVVIYNGTAGQAYAANIQFRSYNSIASQGSVQWSL